MDTVQKLNELDELHAHKILVNSEKIVKRDSILLPVNDRLKDVDEKYNPILDEIDSKITALENEIKAEVLIAGKTVQGNYFMAVFVKGREGSWDSNKLKGFAMAHPEIMAAKKPDGEPTVSIRKVG